jgi:hypothetical protein
MPASAPRGTPLVTGGGLVMQCMNSWEEMARLKNLVAEKVKVIAVLEKERAAMQKLHRQYQKDRLDQDSIESEYGERMRRVNEDLRVAKGLELLKLPHCPTALMPAPCSLLPCCSVAVREAPSRACARLGGAVGRCLQRAAAASSKHLACSEQ